MQNKATMQLATVNPQSVRIQRPGVHRWDEPSVSQQESSVVTLIALSGSAARRSQLLSIVTLSVGFGLLYCYAAASVASVACHLSSRSGKRQMFETVS